MRKMSFFEQNYTTLVPGAPSGLARAPMTRAQYQRGVLQQRQQRQQRQERQRPEFVDSAFPARGVDRHAGPPAGMYVWERAPPTHASASVERYCVNPVDRIFVATDDACGRLTRDHGVLPERIDVIAGAPPADVSIRESHQSDDESELLSESIRLVARSRARCE